MTRRALSFVGLVGAAPLPARLRRRDVLYLALGGVLLAALVSSSFILVGSQNAERRDGLSSRFLIRASLGASFVTEYIQDLAQRQTSRALRDLRDPVDRQGAFQRTADTFEFDAALLLDSTGHVLEVLPERQDVLGTVLTGTYAHLATAADGAIGVSDVVASAAKGVAVVAVAVPFSTPTGRQVFSGAFEAGATPLGNYFDRAVPVAGGRAYLIDSGDRLIVSGMSPTTNAASTVELKPEQLALIEQGSGTITIDGTSYAYARAEVAGTPWHVVLTTPTSALFGPVDQGAGETLLLLLTLAAGSLAGFFLLVRLAKAHAKAAAAASEQTAQTIMLRSVISHNQSLIAVKDLHGRYLLANEAVERAFSVDEHELLGQTDFHLDPELAATWRAHDLRARDGLYEVEECYDTADGPRVYESRKFPLSDSHGHVYATCGVSLDVTERRLYAEATEKARDAALAAAASQRSIAASASHELRTPTTSIIGYIEEVLEDGTLNDEDRELLEVAYRNAQRLNRLIDDLLILGQADSGATVMCTEPTELRTIVEEVTSTFRAAAQQAEVQLTIVDFPDLPLAHIDPQRTEQVISNLVSNALKFTPAGGTVQLSLRARPQESIPGRKQGDMVEVVVADTGVGIEPAELTHIFDRFYRTTTALDMSVKGTGLGLAIAKSMVEAQGGHITVTSEAGRGSTFTVSLPVAAIPETVG